MNNVINNRLVNLWRGDLEPPTKYHIWIKNNKLLLYDGEKWVVFIDHYLALVDTELIRKQLDLFSKLTVNSKLIITNPILNGLDILVGKNTKNISESDTLLKAIEILDNKYSSGYDINISENADSSITINIGGHEFTLLGTGVIDVKATGNNIIIDSNALSSITTESPLEWTKDKKLLHSKSGVKASTYGTVADLTRVNTIIVPSININDTGHIIEAKNSSVTIRDYVELQEDTLKNLERGILLSYSDSKSANPVIKANGLTFNNKTQSLTIPGTVAIGGTTTINNDIIIAKGFKIKGELEGTVVGTATPKIHISKETEYGPASTKLYGHVQILDVLGTIAPLPSNTNENVDNLKLTEGTQAVAASPLMVWNAREDAKQFTKDYFSEDFEDKEGKVYLKWENI